MAPHYIMYSDAEGKEYTETTTSPIAMIQREDELEQQGYRVIRGD